MEQLLEKAKELELKLNKSQTLTNQENHFWASYCTALKLAQKIINVLALFEIIVEFKDCFDYDLSELKEDYRIIQSKLNRQKREMEKLLKG